MQQKALVPLWDFDINSRWNLILPLALRDPLSDCVLRTAMCNKTNSCLASKMDIPNLEFPVKLESLLPSSTCSDPNPEIKLIVGYVKLRSRLRRATK
jgi:hypothetical protein